MTLTEQQKELKRYTDAKKLNEDIKKGKIAKGETIILDLREEDKYKHKWWEYLNPIFLLFIVVIIPIALTFAFFEHAKELIGDLLK